MEENKQQVDREVPPPKVEELEAEWAALSCDTDEG